MQILSYQPQPGEQIQLVQGHVFEFETEEQCQEAIRLIEQHKDSGSMGPIVLPNGEQVWLDPHILWYIKQITRVCLFLLLFSVIR